MLTTLLLDDAAIPAGSPDMVVLATEIGLIGVVTMAFVTSFRSVIALCRMSRRKQLPTAYTIVSEWSDQDRLDADITSIAVGLITEYVRLRNLGGKVEPHERTRRELRQLALLARKHAAAEAAIVAARDGGDESAALVPTAIRDDLSAEFVSQVDRVSEQLTSLRAHVAIETVATKLRTLALPNPELPRGLTAQTGA